MAGITIKVRTVDETMPPIMGTAMRCITSEPVPVLHRMGRQPCHDGGNGHHLWPDALHCAQHNRSMKIGLGEGLALRLTLGLHVLQRMVEIDQHHDARLGGDARKRDEADSHGHRHVEAEPPHQP